MKLLIASQQPSLETWFGSVLDGADQVFRVNPSEVVDFFAKDRFDALVIDIQDESIAFDEIIPAIREIATRRWIPISIFSNNLQDERLAQAFHAGADDVIIASYPAWLLRSKLSALSRVENIQSDLQNAMDRLEQLSLVDTVTQLPNYRGVMREAVRLFGQSNRDEKPFAAVMIEIDHFARYEKDHGHHQAVELFKTLALLVEGSSSRPLDFVGRYDEQTLLVLLPETHAEGAQKVAQAVLKHVREASLPFATSPDHGLVTVSVASNAYDPEETPVSVEQMLDMLKAGLSEAQNTGFDQAIAV